MSGAPAVLIPRGLQQVHPQLEPAFKSIADAIGRLHTTVSGVASQGSGASLSLGNLQQQLQQIQAQIAALDVAAPTYTAGASLGAYNVVRELAAGVLGVADNSSAATCGAVVGITTATAASGKPAAIALNGETVTSPGWSLSPLLPVFLGAAGAITQTPPAAGYVLAVGFALTATSIFVAIGEPRLVAADNLRLPLALDSGGRASLCPLPVLPALSAVPAGRLVDVPAGAVLFFSTSLGLTVSGDLQVEGDIVEMSS